MRVVLDTNVLVAALRSSTGASFRVLEQVGRGAFETVISPPLILEYEDVLSRLNQPIPPEMVAPVLDYLCLVGQPQSIHYLWRPYLRDPKDDHVLEVAFNAGASIVTFNARDFRNATELGVEIWTPRTLLEKIGAL